MLCWGVLVGLGSGSMALAFAATVTNRWFIERRGLVTGILTAGGASGQLVFLPLLAWLVESHGLAHRLAGHVCAGRARGRPLCVLAAAARPPGGRGPAPYGAGAELRPAGAGHERRGPPQP